MKLNLETCDLPRRYRFCLVLLALETECIYCDWSATTPTYFWYHLRTRLYILRSSLHLCFNMVIDPADVDLNRVKVMSELGWQFSIIVAAFAVGGIVYLNKDNDNFFANMSNPKNLKDKMRGDKK
eukprot:g25085.t1